MEDDQGRRLPASLAALVSYIRSKGQKASGIVYCLSRDESEDVCRSAAHGSNPLIE